jgi:hypothetical protein
MSPAVLEAGNAARANASESNSFHRKAAKAAEKRKGFQKQRNETGK